MTKKSLLYKPRIDKSHIILHLNLHRRSGLTDRGPLKSSVGLCCLDMRVQACSSGYFIFYCTSDGELFCLLIQLSPSQLLGPVKSGLNNLGQVERLYKQALKKDLKQVTLIESVKDEKFWRLLTNIRKVFSGLRGADVC